MRTIVTGCIAAFALLGGVAVAQTSPDATTDGALTPPPVGTLSTTHTTRAVDANGNRVESESTTYRNSQGVAEDSKTVTHTVPPTPVTTTTTTTSSTYEQK